ncbi:hypothetical protein IP023_07660 [Sphingobacterium rhinopitheci]|nr:hypothetical protein [Sphingobacterium rhinopitheci]
MLKMMSSVLYSSIIVLLWSSCNTNVEKAEEYVAIYKKDTAYLSLTIYKDTYHGNMRVKGVGKDTELGKVRGKIMGDTLIGDFIYTPYRTKYEKRKAFVLLRQGNILLQGNGLQHVYMGIPYYDPASISFDNPTFVFHRN